MNIGKRTVAAVSQNLVSAGRVLRRIANVIVAAEIWLLMALYAVLMFSDRVPVVGLAALGLLWIARWAATGTLTLATPMDLPILGILAMVPVTLSASVDWALSLPKVYGLILSVAIFYAVVNRVDRLRDVWLTAFALILTTPAIVLLALLGTDWTTWSRTKLFSLPQVYEHLPRLIQGVPRSLRGGFSPNGIGGTLTFFLPLLVSLLWASGEFKSLQKGTDGRLLSLWNRWYRGVLLLSFLLAVFTLILTQSRSSLMGVAVGLLGLAAWRDRRFLWVLPAALLVLFALIVTGRVELLTGYMLRMDIETTGWDVMGTGYSRMELWQRGLYMIQDFPYTGIGIATFDPVVNTMYPLFITGPDARVTHAHNELLQVAVDMGIPGLVAYVALLGSLAVATWSAYRAMVDRWLRALIVGLACGVLAHQVFGLTDAFLLGTKPGVVMWVFMGLIAALYVHRDQMARQFSADTVGNERVKAKGEEDSRSVPAHGGREARSGRRSDRLSNLLLTFGCWVLFSLLGIAFIGDRPYLGLAIGLAGGVVVGLVCV